MDENLNIECEYMDWLTGATCTLPKGHNPYLHYPSLPAGIGSGILGKWHHDASVDGCELFFCESEDPSGTFT